MHIARMVEVFVAFFHGGRVGFRSASKLPIARTTCGRGPGKLPASCATTGRCCERVTQVCCKVWEAPKLVESLCFSFKETQNELLEEKETYPGK